MCGAIRMVEEEYEETPGEPDIRSGTGQNGRVEQRRVVVTGLGVVSAAGIGEESFWKGLQLVPGPGPHAVQDWDPEPWIPKREARRYDRFTQFGLVATREALEGMRRVLGNEHAQTLIAVNNLAIILKDQGKLDEAMDEFHALDLEDLIGKAAVANAVLAQRLIRKICTKCKTPVSVSRDAMLEAVDRHFPPGSSITRPRGGMFAWATLPLGVHATAVLPRALGRGVVFAPEAELVRHALEQIGVPYTFGIPGVHNLLLFETLGNDRIRIIPPTHERSAAFMACFRCCALTACRYTS